MTLAGSGDEGYGGDGGGALCARLNRPTGVDVDEQGNVYIADYNNNRIRRVDPAGVITTVAGSGSRGFSGDGGAAVVAELAGPYGVRAAADGFFIADALNGRVRHVGRDGVIRTVASGFQHPVDVVRGPDGLLYVAEGGGNRVRRSGLTGPSSRLPARGRFVTTARALFPATAGWRSMLNSPRPLRWRSTRKATSSSEIFAITSSAGLTGPASSRRSRVVSTSLEAWRSNRTAASSSPTFRASAVWRATAHSASLPAAAKAAFRGTTAPPRRRHSRSSITSPWTGTAIFSWPTIATIASAN